VRRTNCFSFFNVTCRSQGPVNEFDPSPNGFVGMTFVLKSGEWSRPGRCTADTLSINMNGRSLIDPAVTVSVCDVPKLLTSSPYVNWRKYDGAHAVWTDAPEERDTVSCPASVAFAEKAKRYNFVITLKDSGDGQAPTALYLGKHSLRVNYCD
jgi:hypothetical protein